MNLKSLVIYVRGSFYVKCSKPKYENILMFVLYTEVHFATPKLTSDHLIPLYHL